MTAALFAVDPIVAAKALSTFTAEMEAAPAAPIETTMFVRPGGGEIGGIGGEDAGEVGGLHRRGECVPLVVVSPEPQTQARQQPQDPQHGGGVAAVFQDGNGPTMAPADGHEQEGDEAGEGGLVKTKAARGGDFSKGIATVWREWGRRWATSSSGGERFGVWCLLHSEGRHWATSPIPPYFPKD